MPLQGDSDDDLQEQAYETLEQVTVDYFRADPNALGPFGYSVLSWKVDGPRGFQLKINGIRVEKIGSKTIQPRISLTFHLYAHVSIYYRFLGSVTINVDLSACVPDPNPLVGAYVNAGLVEGINADPDLYFRIIGQRDESGRIRFVESTPGVMITPGRIRFILKLRSHVDMAPDPDVDIDASFGLGVDSPTLFEGSKLVPVSETISVNVSVQKWVYLIPGAQIFLTIALQNAEDSAKERVRGVITRLVSEAIEPRFPTPAGMNRHSVQIYEDMVEVTNCPCPQAPPVSNE